MEQMDTQSQHQGINQVIIVGRAGSDPEVKSFDSGSLKATVSIAVDRPTKERITDWFRCEVWGRQAEILSEYVKKGQLLLLQGKLDIQTWNDPAGNPKEAPVIRVDNFRMLGSKRDQEAAY